MNESLRLAIEELPEELVRKALSILLVPHFNPVFGAVNSVKHEIAAINALQQVGRLNVNPESFELITKLRVIKVKATSLLYHVESPRSIDDKAWNDRIKCVLFSPIIARDKDYFSVNINTSLLKEVIRERLKKLGVAVDDSFSVDFLRILSEGFMQLVVSLLTPKEQSAAKSKLALSGVATSNTSSLLSDLAQAFGEKFSGQAGGILGKEDAQWLVETCSPIRSGETV